MDLNSTQKVSLSLLFTDDRGHTSTTDPVASDVPVWTSNDPNGAITLTVAADGNSAVAAANAAQGTASITVSSADNQGGTVTSDAFVINVTVVAFKIVSVQIVPGPIEQQ